MSTLTFGRTWPRWAARITGGASLGYCLLVIRGDGLGESAAAERGMLPALLLFAALAYGAAWWREIEGGTALATIAVALGGIAFASAEQDPFLASLAASLPLFLTGGLFVWSGWYDLGARSTTR
jgi:hypothetical protein